MVFVFIIIVFLAKKSCNWFWKMSIRINIIKNTISGVFYFFYIVSFFYLYINPNPTVPGPACTPIAEETEVI